MSKKIKNLAVIGSTVFGTALASLVSVAHGQVSDPLGVASTTADIVETGKYYIGVGIDVLWPVFLGAALIVLALVIVIGLFVLVSRKMGGGGGSR